ncbi:MAG: DNA-binding response regulator [Chitinophagaceae bacterium]|nr:DNA-binding response regulator [Ferruginibacter sp.]MDB5223025.1 DNA-binding response regulator [Chitinophagaceae bacterium]
MPVKIAIVDDKLIVRKAIKDKLRASAEMNIILEACNGEVFLESIKELGEEDLPEIVLMDIEMPEMDGIQTIAVASMLFPKMKFIVLTVFDNNEKIFEAIKAGANGYLLKDDDAVNLHDAILHVMNYDAVPMSPAIARKTLGLLKTGLPEASNSVSSGLSTREYGVLQHLVEGLEYKQIAEKLFISPATVRTHISNIYQKLHVTSKAQAIKLAYKNSWL